MELAQVPDFYRGYVEKVHGLGLIPAMLKTGDDLISLVRNLPESRGDHSYAAGKWTIKDIILHITDAERIFAYRALRFARNDASELPGYDHNAFVEAGEANKRALHNLLAEFTNVRAASIDLFSSFDEEARVRSGFCNGHEMTVEMLGFIISGHLFHHLGVIHSKYL